MEIPVITTPRLVLRGFAPSDLDPLCAILGDRDVIRYMPRAEPWPREVAQKVLDRQRDHWHNHGYGWYAVQDRASKELIGWCGLCFLDETEEVEIKYLLKRSHWGRGLATEGAGLCVVRGFEDLNLDAIIGLVLQGNTASQRVLEKLGLVFTNEARYFGLDLLRYAMDREQFEALRATSAGQR